MEDPDNESAINDAEDFSSFAYNEENKEFIDHLKVRNTLAGGLGREYERETGIPQGDPLSMMSTALPLNIHNSI